jgi:hypothetical protein
MGGVPPSILQFVTNEVKQVVSSWLNELSADFFENRFIELTAGWLSALTVCLHEAVRPEKIIIAQMIKKFLAFYGTRRFISS